jgi:hypothetical protein
MSDNSVSGQRIYLLCDERTEERDLKGEAYSHWFGRYDGSEHNCFELCKSVADINIMKAKNLLSVM